MLSGLIAAAQYAPGVRAVLIRLPAPVYLAAELALSGWRSGGLCRWGGSLTAGLTSGLVVRLVVGRALPLFLPGG
ncbi:MAG: hypothetical protein DESF_00888 [Desulfovibrio sp.]